MKIETNRLLDSDQVTDLYNHLSDLDLPGLDKPMFPEDPPAIDVDELAIRGAIDVPEQTGNVIIDWISKHVPRVIIWVDGKKVVDKYGNSPLDIDAEDIVDSLLSEGENEHPELGAFKGHLFSVPLTDETEKLMANIGKWVIYKKEGGRGSRGRPKISLSRVTATCCESYCLRRPIHDRLRGDSCPDHRGVVGHNPLEVAHERSHEIFLAVPM